jgi:hypothetical protein
LYPAPDTFGAVSFNGLKYYYSIRAKLLSIFHDVSALWNCLIDEIDVLCIGQSEVDIFLRFPPEGAHLTGCTDYRKQNDLLLVKGAKNVVVKLGAGGPYLRN